MRVLVTAASRHGGTAEMAGWISDGLRVEGHDAVVLDPDAVLSLDGFDAVILGSGVYAGHWLRAARSFVDRFGRELVARPVWIYSSGPVGDPRRPSGGPADGETMRLASGAREHRVFAGRIDRDTMGIGERAVIMAMRVTDRDDRPRDEVAAWASEIAAALGVIARRPELTR